MIITCLLQGIHCDTGIPRTFYEGNICSVSYRLAAIHYVSNVISMPGTILKTKLLSLGASAYLGAYAIAAPFSTAQAWCLTSHSDLSRILEHWNSQKTITSIRQHFSRWLFEIIHIICFEMHMDRPDKSENIVGIRYQLSKHLTFYVSSLISLFPLERLQNQHLSAFSTNYSATALY